MKILVGRSLYVSLLLAEQAERQTLLKQLQKVARWLQIGRKAQSVQVSSHFSGKGVCHWCLRFKDFSYYCVVEGRSCKSIRIWGYRKESAPCIEVAEVHLMDIFLKKTFRASSMSRLADLYKEPSLRDASSVRAFCDQISWYRIDPAMNFEQVRPYVESWDIEMVGHLSGDIQSGGHTGKSALARLLAQESHGVYIDSLAIAEGGSYSLEAFLFDAIPHLEKDFQRGACIHKRGLWEFFRSSAFFLPAGSDGVCRFLNEPVDNLLEVSADSNVMNAQFEKGLSQYLDEIGGWWMSHLLEALAHVEIPEKLPPIFVDNATFLNASCQQRLKQILGENGLTYFKESQDFSTGALTFGELRKSRVYNTFIHEILLKEGLKLSRHPEVLGRPLFLVSDGDSTGFLRTLSTLQDVLVVADDVSFTGELRRFSQPKAHVLGVGSFARLLVLWRPSSWGMLPPGRREQGLVEALVRLWLAKAGEAVVVFDERKDGFWQQAPWKGRVVEGDFWFRFLKGNLSRKDWRSLAIELNEKCFGMQLRFVVSCFILANEQDKALHAHLAAAQAMGFQEIVATGLLELGQISKAATVYEEMGNYERASQLWLRLGDEPRAIAADEAHLMSGMDPLKSAAYFEKCSMYAKAVGMYVKGKDYRKAANLCEKYLEKPTKAAQLYMKAGKPKNAARIYLEIGDLEGAARAFIAGQFFKKAERLLEEADQVPLLIDLYWRGKFYRRLLNYFERHRDFDGSVKALRALGDTADLDQAECLMTKRQFFKALVRFYVREDWIGVGNAGMRARCHAISGQAFERVGHFEKAARAYYKGNRLKKALLCYLKTPLDSPATQRRIRAIMEALSDPSFLQDVAESCCDRQEWHAAGWVFEFLGQPGRAGCCHLAAGVLKRVKICWRRIETAEELEVIGLYSREHGFVKEMAEFFLSRPQLCFQYWSRGAFKLESMPGFFGAMASYFSMYRNDKGLELFLLMFELRDKSYHFFEYVMMLLEQRGWYDWLVRYMGLALASGCDLARVKAKVSSEIKRAMHEGESLVWRQLLIGNDTAAIIELKKMAITAETVPLYWRAQLMDRVIDFYFEFGMSEEIQSRLLCDAPLIFATKARGQGDYSLAALGYLWGGQYFDAAKHAHHSKNWDVYLKAKFLLGEKTELRRLLMERGPVFSIAKVIYQKRLKEREIEKIPGLASLWRYLSAVIKKSGLSDELDDAP